MKGLCVFCGYLFQPYLYLCTCVSCHVKFLVHFACSQAGKVLNFKINCEGGDYFIAPKRRFNTVIGLLDSYSSVPIKSKKAANEKIFLLQPIPVDPVLEQRHKQLLEEKGKSSCMVLMRIPTCPHLDCHYSVLIIGRVKRVCN